MTNTLNTGVYKEEWAVKLQERLNKPVTYKEVADVIYSNTKIFNLPYMSSEFVAQTGTRGTAYGFSDFTLTNETIDIATKKLVPIFIDRADLSQCQYTTQMEMADRQGALLDDQVETAMLGNHGSWTDVGDSSGVVTSGVTTQITVSSSNIDDIVRGIKRIIATANGTEMAQRYGIFFVWRPQDFEYLEQFLQANGYNLADLALKNGIDSGYYALGAYHYVSNSHTANHVMAGVRKLFKIGILRTTYGQIVQDEEPATADGALSGVSMIARIDYGILAPAGYTTLIYDVNVA